MNKTEAAFAAVLEKSRLAGDVLAWWFEPASFRLAHKTFYKPDFMAQRSDGSLDILEVKGHWEDDARVKIKVFAREFPIFRVFAVKKAGRRTAPEWQFEEIIS